MKLSLGWRAEHLSNLKLTVVSLVHCHSGNGETEIADSAVAREHAAAPRIGWMHQLGDYLWVGVAVEVWWEQ